MTSPTCTLLFLHGVVDGRVELELSWSLGPFSDRSTTCEMTLPYPPEVLSVSSGVSSVTSPSYTSLFSLMRSPMARRKFSIRISVFLTSEEYTSLPDHGAEGYLGSELLRDAERQRGLPRTRRARHEQRAAGHLLSADHVDHHPARLARLLLAHPSGGLRDGRAFFVQPETL